jgi:hypothetical protein
MSSTSVGSNNLSRFVTVLSLPLTLYVYLVMSMAILFTLVRYLPMAFTALSFVLISALLGFLAGMGETWFHPVWDTKYQKYYHLVENLRYHRGCMYSYIQKVLCWPNFEFPENNGAAQKVLYHV